MIQKLDLPVSVILSFNHQIRTVMPKKVLFEGKVHKIIKLGYHHTYYQGKTLIHIFSVVSDTLFFRLKLDTSNLHWRLEEIADDESN